MWHVFCFPKPFSLHIKMNHRPSSTAYKTPVKGTSDNERGPITKEDIMLFKYPSKGVISNYVKEEKNVVKKIPLKDYLQGELDIIRFAPTKRDFWNIVEKSLDRFLVCGCSSDETYMNTTDKMAGTPFPSYNQSSLHSRLDPDIYTYYDSSFSNYKDELNDSNRTPDTERHSNMKHLGALPPSVYVLAAAYDNQVRSSKGSGSVAPSPSSVAQL